MSRRIRRDARRGDGRRYGAGAAVSIAGLPVAIAARAQAGSNQFDIRLDPPELGRIDVRLDVDSSGQVTSHVTVDRPETLTLLQSQQPQLERALEQAGLKTADNGLQFSLRDQSFAGQNGGSGGNAQPNPTPQLVIPDADLAPVETTQIYSRVGSRQRRRYSRVNCNRLRTDHDDDSPAHSSTSDHRPSTTSSSASTDNAGLAQLADNFNSFLTLLTTQLQNQDPLDPLDTNQFTQQLVEFTSVQQQVDMNTNMQTLISLQQTSEATSAMQFLGANVTLSGTSAALAANSPATWSLNSPSPATANITITNSTGQTGFNRHHLAQCRHPDL